MNRPPPRKDPQEPDVATRATSRRERLRIAARAAATAGGATSLALLLLGTPTVVTPNRVIVTEVNQS